MRLNEREDILDLTREWTGERFPNGRFLRSRSGTNGTGENGAGLRDKRDGVRRGVAADGQKNGRRLPETAKKACRSGAKDG